MQCKNLVSKWWRDQVDKASGWQVDLPQVCHFAEADAAMPADTDTDTHTHTRAHTGMEHVRWKGRTQNTEKQPICHSGTMTKTDLIVWPFNTFQMLLDRMDQITIVKWVILWGLWHSNKCILPLLLSHYKLMGNVFWGPSASCNIVDGWGLFKMFDYRTQCWRSSHVHSYESCSVVFWKPKKFDFLAGKIPGSLTKAVNLVPG